MTWNEVLTKYMGGFLQVRTKNGPLIRARIAGMQFNEGKHRFTFTFDRKIQQATPQHRWEQCTGNAPVEFDTYMAGITEIAPDGVRIRVREIGEIEVFTLPSVYKLWEEEAWYLMADKTEKMAAA